MKFRAACGKMRVPFMKETCYKLLENERIKSWIVARGNTGFREFIGVSLKLQKICYVIDRVF